MNGEPSRAVTIKLLVTVILASIVSIGLGMLLVSAVSDRPSQKALTGAPTTTALAVDAKSNPYPVVALAPLPVDRFLLAGAVKSFTHDYAQYLALSKLSDEDKGRLMRLAAERGLLAIAVPRALKSGQFTNVAEVDAFYRAESARLAGEMKILTGDEYEAFYKASEEVPIRQEMDVFASMVAGSGAPLTADQKALLVVFTWQEYKAAGVDLFLSRRYSRIDDARKFVAEMERKSRANTVIRSYAAEFLTETQLGKLAGFQIAQIQGMWLSKHLPKESGRALGSTVTNSVR